MDEIRTMLNKVASGELSVEDAVLELKKSRLPRLALTTWALQS